MAKTPEKAVPETPNQTQNGRLMSVRALAELAGMGRDTCTRKLKILQSVPGPGGAKLYDSRLALPVLFDALKL